MPKGDFWGPKLRTCSAMYCLCRAQLLINRMPFHRWSSGLGFAHERDGAKAIEEAVPLAADVEWAAKRLPFASQCLPRAMALSWKLSRKRIGHAVVIAVRPQQERRSPDALHAWVEVAGAKIIGDLPGPWIEVARFGEP